MYKIARRIANSRVATSPQFEGELGAPLEQVVLLLSDILACKYSIDNAYRSYADRIRGPFRDAIVAHWQEHAKEEREAAYDFAMKIVGLGGDPVVMHVDYASVAQPTIDQFCQELAQKELDLIAKNRELINIAGDHTSLKVLAENTILNDTQHLDDLRRMCLSYVG